MNHAFDIEHAQQYGVHEAIIIHNFQFWIVRNRANGTHQHDGRTWLYNSVKALNVLFPYMTTDKIRRALERLEKDEVLVTGFYNVRPADRTKWFAFADEAKFLPPLTHLAKPTNGGDKGGKDHLAKTTNGGSEGGDSHLAKPTNALANPTNGIAGFAKSTNTTDITADIVSDTPPMTMSAEEVFELAWAAYPERPGASKKDSWKAFGARVKAGADPLAILDGVKAYAAYVVAKGTEPEFIKQPVTFFGPGDHYRADWTPPKKAAQPAAAAAATRPVKFDPNAFVNSGAAYATPVPAANPGNDPFTIDAEFVERAA